MYRPIAGGEGHIGRHEEVSHGMAACFGYCKTYCIAVDCKNHIAGMICYDCFIICCCIVKELCDAFQCAFGWVCLLQCYCTKSGKHCADNSLCIKKESASYFLENFVCFLPRGVGSSGTTNCCFWLYCGGTWGCGWYCGCFDVWCWNQVRALQTYPSINKWTALLL